ncbi:discoidin domain-containing protein [Cognatilysobacter tabacisoli]
MKAWRVAAALAALVPLGALAQERAAPRVLDDFESPGTWRVVTSDQVSGTLRRVDGDQGAALCLDYDFNGVSGYAGLQRDLSLEYPADYEFAYRLRGESPANDLQFKLVDASGDNVWWVNRTRVAFPGEWTPVVHKRRHISRAWGPAPDPTLRRSARLEFTVYNSAGGKGSVCFDTLTFRERPLETDPPPRPLASATVAHAPASLAVDGSEATRWRVPAGTAASLTLDLGRMREFGGLRLRWAPDEAATRYAISLSDDAADWRPARRVVDGNGGLDPIALPESEARYVRVDVEAGEGARIGLAEVTVEPLAFAATANDFVKSIAQASPRGTYPRGFHGEQPYWTVVGIDGGPDQGLIGEDGAIELGKGSFSIEPFVVSAGRLVTWADVETAQSLQDGYLPIPSVRWTHPDFALDVTAFAHGTPERSQLVGRYRLTNTGATARDYTLALAARPLQVNPPTQFLSVTGGVSPIRALAVDAGGWRGAGRDVRLTSPGDHALASTFDQGEIVERLRATDWSRFALTRSGAKPASWPLAGRASVDDPTGLASGAVFYTVRLQPGESREFDWRSGLSGAAPDPAASAAALQDEVAAQWREALDRVTLRVPEAGRGVVDTLRTGLAHMLISRIGPRLQPGTRSYARAWIRDGAMIGEGLLRMGREDVAEEFLRWYAPYQFDNGKVPCCVDDRGSDPVPENDSHGELVFTVAEVYRYTRDRRLLEDLWPNVVGAVKYMDELRLSERTAANRAVNPAFYGMMPASISHEGYSAKPMHSYWDNFWALRGYKDAVQIAQWLGRERDARRFAASRDQFAADLVASLEAATRQHGIGYLPGAAELGDFDATSTTIALAPGGEQHRLPQDKLLGTFERYWREFVARRDGTREWKDYTPYELRTVGTFVRLGWRDRAHEALDFFFADQQPRGWNQWAEVVSRTPRTPFFVGDLPHAWVESDYVRSALDLFAYTRERDDALVIAAGIPDAWVAADGVQVANLRTPYGPLAYTLRAEGSALALDVPAGLKLPAGGLVVSLPPGWRNGAATLDGRAVKLDEGELRIKRLPARATVERP